MKNNPRLINKSQLNSKKHNESTQPIIINRRKDKNDKKIYSTNSGKEYSNTSNLRSRIGSTEKSDSIPKINNYRVLNPKKESGKTKKSKDIDHKKFGIRERHYGGAVPISSQEDKNLEIIKKEPKILSKYQSKTSRYQPSKQISIYNNNKDNIRINNNITISGSSYSNYLSSDNNTNKCQSNNNSKYNLNTEPNIKITSNKKSLINKKKELTTPVLRTNDKSSSLNRNTSRNNTVSHSIKEIKNSSYQKPYVLNERKCDIIRYQVKYKLKYNNAEKGDDSLINNSNNHSIYERKNITKELLTVADLPDTVKIYHRYKYNINPNITNTRTLSIDATGKKPKKEVIVVPRKNEIIIPTKPNTRSSSVIEAKKVKHEIYNTNSPIPNIQVKNKLINEPKTIQRKYESKIAQKKYEPKNNQTKNNSKIVLKKYQLKNIQKKDVSKIEQRKYEIKMQQRGNEPKIEQKKYESKIQQMRNEAKNNQKYEPKIQQIRSEAKNNQKYEPKIQQIRNEAKNNQKKYESKIEQRKNELKSNQKNEPKIEQRKYEEKTIQKKYEPKNNQKNYEFKNIQKKNELIGNQSNYVIQNDNNYIHDIKLDQINSERKYNPNKYESKDSQNKSTPKK